MPLKAEMMAAAAPVTLAITAEATGETARPISQPMPKPIMNMLAAITTVCRTGVRPTMSFWPAGWELEGCVSEDIVNSLETDAYSLL